MRKLSILLIALGLIVVACGGGEPESSGIPSLDETAGRVATTSAAPLEADVALLEFSQCMRDAGIALPDIAIDDAGAPILDPALLDVIDVASDQFQEAFDTCQPILARSQAFNVDIDPQLQAQIEDQLVVFSQCMRDNGFDDFPDPGSVGSGPVYPLSILAQFSDPEFEAAIEVCQRELAFPGLNTNP